MGQQERVSRRTVTASAQLALDKVAECITAINVQADRNAELNTKLAATAEQVAACESGLAALNASLTKQIDRVSVAVGDERTHRLKLAEEQRAYVDRRDGDVLREMARQNVKLARMVEKFQQMPFLARVWWLFTGHVEIDFNPNGDE